MSTDDGIPRPVPTPEEEAQARAYLAGFAHGLEILLDAWTGWGDGTATTLTPDGIHLIFTSDELHPFDAVIPCTRHKRHRVGVTWRHELDEARAAVDRCSATDPPPVIERICQPRLLWLVTEPDPDPATYTRREPA